MNADSQSPARSHDQKSISSVDSLSDQFYSWQLLLSNILSTAYALVMMAVIVGTALQLGEDGLGSPSAIFLISLSGSFFIAALLHPQEFWCIVPGICSILSKLYLRVNTYFLVRSLRQHKALIHYNMPVKSYMLNLILSCFA